MNFTLNKVPILKILISIFSFSLVIVLSLILSCSESKKHHKNRIVIGIESDVETINPMYAFSNSEGDLIDLLFMKPAIEIWNDKLGEIQFKPMLAKKWEWTNDENSLRIYLRDDIYWSDGKPITVEDIIYTFDIYSNPKAQTRFYGQFKNFNTIDGLHIDIAKTFEKVSSTCIDINFKAGSNPNLLDINLEIIPKHVWSQYKIDEFPNAQVNFDPITSGPFKLSRWERESAIFLQIDSSSFLFNPKKINQIVFKIIPDYKSRIIQLETGTIDILNNIKGEDTGELEKNNSLKIISLNGRDYDYIGWNHLDPKEYGESKVVTNKLFSSAVVRKALSHAVNRKEIIESYLNESGELCKGPVSPMFKKYIEVDLPFYEYSPKLAKQILAENGWQDKNGDGIIEKDNEEFRFNLYIASGNPRRNYVANIVKNNLGEVGIDVSIQSLEMGAFVERLMKRDFDAWLAGWTVQIPIDLNPYWNSDPDIGFLNFSSYQNKEKDVLLDSLQLRLTDSEKASLYKRMQKIFYEDEPVTFLFWIDNFVGYNRRITSINFSILGYVKNAWEWQVD